MQIPLAVGQTWLPCHVLIGQGDVVLGLLGRRLLICCDQANAHHVRVLELIDRFPRENLIITRGLITIEMIGLPHDRRRTIAST